MHRIASMGSVAAVTIAVIAVLHMVGGAREARQLSPEAASIKLSSVAGALRDSRPEAAARIALEAYRISPLPEARSALLTALVARRGYGTSTILKASNKPVRSVAFHPGGQIVASTGDNEAIQFWNARNGAKLGDAMPGFTSGGCCLAFSPDGRTLASGGRTVRLWDVQARRPLGKSLDGPLIGVTSIIFSPDGRRLAASYVGGVLVWDTSEHRLLGGLNIGPRFEGGVAFSPDGRMLASAGWDGTIRLWDVRTLSAIGAPIYNGPVRHDSRIVLTPRSLFALAFSPDGRMVASAEGGGAIRLWDIHTRKQIGRPLLGHKLLVFRVAFSPDGRTLASAGSDKTVRRWNLRTHTQIGPPLRGHNGVVGDVSFSPDGRMLASASWDSTARLWSIVGATSSQRKDYRTSGPVRAIAFGPRSDVLASSGDDGVRVWDLHDHRALRKPVTERAGTGNSVALSPDGRVLASAGHNRRVRLWDLRSGVGHLLSGHAGSVNDIAFSPDGRLLASASDDRTVRLWDVRRHRQLGRPLTGRAGATSVSLSHDGRILASGGADGTVTLWRTGRHARFVAALLGPRARVGDVAFGRGGHTLASASWDGTIRFWDTRTHRPAGRPLVGHHGPVTALAFTPDGLTLASTDAKGWARLWDVRSHKPLVVLPPRRARLRGVAIGPDGHTLAYGGDDAVITVRTDMLSDSFAEFRATVCSIAGGPVGTSEWRRLASAIPYRNSCA